MYIKSDYIRLTYMTFVGGPLISSLSNMDEKKVKKFVNFVNTPIEYKDVADLPGIGMVYGARLSRQNYSSARDVLKKFLDLGKNETLFKTWLIRITNTNDERADECYQALKNYCLRFHLTPFNLNNSSDHSKQVVRFSDNLSQSPTSNRAKYSEVVTLNEYVNSNDYFNTKMQNEVKNLNEILNQAQTIIARWRWWMSEEDRQLFESDRKHIDMQNNKAHEMIIVPNSYYSLTPINRTSEELLQQIAQLRKELVRLKIDHAGVRIQLETIFKSFQRI